MSANLGEVFSGGATTSQHVDAEDNQHFEDTTFRLKRTRSLGTLDEFIPDKEKREESKDSGVHPAAESDPSKPAESQPEVDDEQPDEAHIVGSPDILPFDDTDISLEPSRHVDYLLHQWDMLDISKSWRYVIRKRPYVANAARLENASWRTWAQRRGNLKTINPEVVNWLKDSDVTWLYGPILKDEEHEAGSDDEAHRAATTATSAAAGDISLPNKSKNAPKLILRRRTVQDTMISHANLMKLQNATSQMHERQKRAALRAKGSENAEAGGRPGGAGAGGVPEFDDYDAISAKLNSQYRMPAAAGREDTQSPAPEPSATATPEVKERRIHFNNEVQQCIAVDYHSSDEYSSDDYDYNDELGDDFVYEEQVENSENNDSDSDSDDGFVFSVRSPSLAAVAPGLALPLLSQLEAGGSPTSASESVSTSQSYKTIHLLPSTILNLGSSDEESDDENPYTLSQSHNSSSRGYDYYYDYNTVYTVDPNHAIYGRKTPDVVDVPENIGVGSNVDYATIEDTPVNRGHERIAQEMENSAKKGKYEEEEDRNATENEKKKEDEERKGETRQGKPVFAYVDPDSDSDSDSSDEGLLISTRRSSQSLAQEVFSRTTPAESKREENEGRGGSGDKTDTSGDKNDKTSRKTHTERPSQPEYPTPHADAVRENIQSINPSHSLTGLSKQPPSSGQLSLQFFGTTSIDPLLSALFFEGSKGNTGAAKSPLVEADTGKSDSFQASRSLSPAEKPHPSATTPLPPYTSAQNAFSAPRRTALTFVFDSDSDSDSENGPEDSVSYASLAQVADQNGIPSPSLELDAKGASGSSQTGDNTRSIAGNILNWKSG